MYTESNFELYCILCEGETSFCVLGQKSTNSWFFLAHSSDHREILNSKIFQVKQIKSFHILINICYLLITYKKIMICITNQKFIFLIHFWICFVEALPSSTHKTLFGVVIFWPKQWQKWSKEFCRLNHSNLYWGSCCHFHLYEYSESWNTTLGDDTFFKHRGYVRKKLQHKSEAGMIA